MQLSTRQELLIAVATSFLVLGYALPDLMTWLGLN